MAEAKRSKRSKKDSSPAIVRTERRFVPAQSTTLVASLAAGGLGAALLGAGVYGQFVRAEPHRYGSYLVGAGALVLAVVILVAPEPPRPLLVGDGGVAIDDDSEAPRRILWCDVEKIHISGNAVVVEGASTKLSAPLSTHAQAAAWIVREARARIPARVSIDEEQERLLPEASEAAGEQRPLARTQVAGRRCKASERVISFEPDARLCPRCGECYHKEHVPERCLTCEGSMEAPYLTQA
jgi:hypothetical protein